MAGNPLPRAKGTGSWNCRGSQPPIPPTHTANVLPWTIYPHELSREKLQHSINIGLPLNCTHTTWTRQSLYLKKQHRWGLAVQTKFSQIITSTFWAGNPVRWCWLVDCEISVHDFFSYDWCIPTQLVLYTAGQWWSLYISYTRILVTMQQ